MNIFIAQQNYHIGNFEANTNIILKAIEEAKINGGDLIVFSELSVCGYPPRDFLEFNDFIEQCEASVEKIRLAADSIAVLVGAPSRNPEVAGKDLFNSVFFIYENKIKNIVAKTLLPTYDIFDEYRYFEPANEWKVVDFKGKKIAVTICEDIWNVDENPMYRISPMDKLMEQQPDLMINLSASPFDYMHADGRLQTIKKNVAKYNLPIIYSNTVGSQTEIVFDGGSLAMNKNGVIIQQLPYFNEAIQSVSWQDLSNESTESSYIKEPNFNMVYPQLNIDAIHQALIIGIRDYFEKLGFKEAIVASSGGIDSAVVLALACEALGSHRVRALLMPSAFSSEHSISDAVQLSQNLNNHFDIIPINTVFETYNSALEKVFEGTSFGLAEENLQSRIRGAMVMALANKKGYILLNTSNKSELSTGYGTLYGDMAGGLGVLGDCYKMQVYALAQYINREREIIPKNILTKAPSAELRPNQKDSDSLPDYEILDQILFQYIERRKGPKEIIQQGFEQSLVTRVLKLVNMNEYKRNQFCPIIRVSPKAFGIGRRVPIVAKYLS